MKKIIHTLVLACFLTCFMACNDLEQAPTNKFTDAEYWTSADRAILVMNMAYNQMYNAGKMWTDEALSDNLIEVRGNPSTTIIRKGQANPSTTIFKDEWQWLFEGIKTTNVFMANVDLVPNLDATVATRMKAEIRFIRAYLFFRMSNFYGDIPFFLEDIDVAGSKTIRRTPRAQVLAALHTELDEVIPVLPKKEELPAAERGRITKAAAMMLKIRLYLMQGDMPKVEQYCGMLINNQSEYGAYRLFTTATEHFSAYENLFASAYEYNDEVILDYTYVTLDKIWQDFIDMVPPSVTGYRVTGKTPTQSLVDSYIMLTSGLPVRGPNTKPTPYDSDPSYNDNPNTMYTGRDPRLAATVVYHGATWKDKNTSGAYVEQTINITPGSGENAYGGDGGENRTQTGYYIRKWFDVDHGLDLRMHNNIIMMRYADVLLMYAEACERNGTFTEDVWNKTIRPIRERAGFTTAAVLDYPGTTNLREIIRRERRCELALEGLRYYDLIRWGSDPEGTFNLLNGTVYGAKMANALTDYIRVETFKYTANRDEWWSLPQDDINKTPTLLPNNPGY
ncbi:MAG: RagB/SusD family nutrient uptake outer membrane protein [Prevotellaceae bacterium]|nr:RagB/SusD family nutrient uptake outer membrane protein [Prevotellaceae bacterium]